MKSFKSFVFLFLWISFTAYSQDSNTLHWFTNFEEAKKVAKKESKPILVYFTGSDWCAPCKMLKEDFFETETFKKEASNLVLLMVDYPRRIDILTTEQLDYNKKLISKLNPEKTFPKILGLTAKGKEINAISGYSLLRDSSHHFEFLEELLQ